jgi:hypothetical protein
MGAGVVVAVHGDEGSYGGLLAMAGVEAGGYGCCEGCFAYALC